MERTTPDPPLCDACHRTVATWLAVLPTGRCLRFCTTHYSQHQTTLTRAQATLTGSANPPQTP